MCSWRICRGGQGDCEQELELTPFSLDVVDAELGDDDQAVEIGEGSSDDAHPLLIFYDCETTGLSIYNDHITCTHIHDLFV